MDQLTKILEDLTTSDFQDREQFTDLLENLREELQDHRAEPDLKRVRAALQQLADQMEAAGVKPGQDSYDLLNPMEKLLCDFKFRRASNPGTNRPVFSFTPFYETYAEVLLLSHRFAEAGAILKKALAWNPFRAYLYRLYGWTVLEQGDMAAVRKAALDLLAVACTPEDVSVAYWNLATYYLDREEYDAAYCCYLMSRTYDPEHGDYEEALEEIRQESPEPIRIRNRGDRLDVLERYQIPYGKVLETARLATKLGMFLYQKGDFPLAGYFLTSAYGLSHNKRVKEMLDQIEEKQEQWN